MMRTNRTSRAFTACGSLVLFLASLLHLARGQQSCSNDFGENFCEPSQPSYSLRYCPAGCRPGECGRSSADDDDSVVVESAALDRKFVSAHQFAGSMCLSTCSNSSEYMCEEESVSIKGFSYCSKLGGCSVQTDCSVAKSFYRPSCAACAAVYPLGCWPLLHASGDHGLPPPTWHILKAPLYALPELDDSLPPPPGLPVVAKGMGKGQMSERWKKYSTVGDGTCNSQCEAEKAQMCQIHPGLCMQLRCEDLDDSEGDGRLEATCNALQNLNNHITLSLTSTQMLLRWRLYHSMLGSDCDDTCVLAKQNMCHLHPRLCVALRCEDAATGRGGAESLRPACTGDAIETPEQVLTSVGPAATHDEEALTVEMSRASWRLTWALWDRTCEKDCLTARQETCQSFPLLCAELWCEDAWSLLAPADMLPACSPLYPPRQTPSSPLTELQVAQQWAQLLDASPESCGSDCWATKKDLCAHQPELCLRMLCGETSMAGHWRPELEQVCAWSALDRDLVVLLPDSAVVQQQVKAKWAETVSGQAPCGAECKAYKLRICLGNPRLCVALSCTDAEVYGAAEEVNSLCAELLSTRAATPAATVAFVSEDTGPFPASTPSSTLAAAGLTVVEVAKLSGPQLADVWAAVVPPVGPCGLDCLAFRFQVCKERGFHCIELTCADAQPGTELRRLCSDAAGLQKAKGSPGKGAGQELRTAVSISVEQSFASFWEGLSTEDGSCDQICEAQRAQLCAIDRSLCMVLRCQDNLAGSGPFSGNAALSIICQEIVDEEIRGDSLLQTSEDADQLAVLGAVWVNDFLGGQDEALVNGLDPPSLLAKYEEMFAQAWGALNRDDGTCGTECYEAKTELCRQDVVMCIFMRCLDVAAGIDPNSASLEVQEACVAVRRP